MRSVPRSVADPRRQRPQRQRTLNVLEAARRAGVPRVVYASSSSVYGDRPDLPKREDQPPAPISPYAVSKAAGEQYAAVWHRLYGVETVGLEPVSRWPSTITCTPPASRARGCTRSAT
jgi:nucleoside-diphosphate-sugar epimerase